MDLFDADFDAGFLEAIGMMNIYILFELLTYKQVYDQLDR